MERQKKQDMEPYLEEARGRRWPATPGGWAIGSGCCQDGFLGVHGLRREISWRGQKRAAIGNHDRVHDPLFTRKANVNNISFLHFLAGSSAHAVHTREQLSVNLILRG